MKLLIRGGSIAAGYGVSRSYSEILAEFLRPCGIEVINRSRYRETSFDGIETFYEDIDPFKPDILFLQFGVDDAFGYVYRSEFQENMVRLIRLARNRFNPAVVLATSHTFDNPCDMEAVNIFYRSSSIVASDLGCVLIPVHVYWRGFLAEHNLTGGNLTLPDPRYPNELGHRVIAEAVKRWFVRSGSILKS